MYKTTSLVLVNVFLWTLQIKQKSLPKIAVETCVCMSVCMWCVLKACSRRLAVGESGSSGSVIIGSDDDSCTGEKQTLFSFLLSSSLSFAVSWQTLFSQSPLIPFFFCLLPSYHIMHRSLLHLNCLLSSSSFLLPTFLQLSSPVSPLI